jgi:dihydrofolate reductase
MRKLFSFNMVTLDGYFAGPNDEIDWHNVDGEFNEFAIEQTSASTVDMLLFGRVTYQLMASYWSTPDAIKNDPIVADMMNRTPKIVFSRTLEKAGWNNTRLIKDHIAEEITKLKQQPGKDLALFGSANLMSTLVKMDLINEHRIMVNPIVLGSGKPLFQDIHTPLKLKLVNTRVFRSGNVLLTYQPIR